MGCFSRRAVFFTVARFLGLALATVRFLVAAFAILRALLCFAEVPLRNFARFFTFDRFLRLAMIVLFRLFKMPTRQGMKAHQLLQSKAVKSWLNSFRSK